jgi:putative membrane protein
VRLINTIVAVIVAILVVLFAVSNRMAVTVEIWPFPYQLDLPLYALILLAVLLGFIAGAIGMWMMGSAKRRELRRLRKQMRAMEQSLVQQRDLRDAP